LKLTPDEAVRSLIGQRIGRVKYFDVPDAEYEPDATIDSLSFGLDLEMVGGDSLGVLVEEARLGGQLAFVRKSSLGVLLGPHSERVANARKWEPFLEQPVTAARIHWFEWKGARYPVGLELETGRGRVRVWVGEFWETGKFGELCDQITIFFREEDFRKAEVGPFRRDVASDEAK
jgi:hypothetical protein